MVETEERPPITTPNLVMGNAPNQMRGGGWLAALLIFLQKKKKKKYLGFSMLFHYFP